MKSKYILLAILLLALQQPAIRAQEVMSLEKGQIPATASLSQFDWLQGYWTGTGFGGFCDEVWTAPLGNSMQGIFRFAQGDTLIFSEYMVLLARDSTVTLKLKHFSADLSPWEEKEEWLEFRLVKIEGQTAWFEGLTYSRQGRTLIILLDMKDEKSEWVEEFRFELKD
jgi:hypothetical protein